MILKNGKRMDGCSDITPIGTIQAFVGLNPPIGYLLCQGQKVSKTVYPELYQMCKSLFGAETSTEFYLPDLRGKTLAGLSTGVTSLNQIGKKLGSETHQHSTSNHTLTVDEIPSHTHNIKFDQIWNTNGGTVSIGTTSGGPYGGSGFVEYTGGSKPHNHGNTTSASSYQPTVVVNWIVKAYMIIPTTSRVENNLNSTSTINSLSAYQGKVLNEQIKGQERTLNDKINKVVEHNGNEQGEWIKFNNGTMIIMQEYTVANPGNYPKWPPKFPIKFINVPFVTYSYYEPSAEITNMSFRGPATTEQAVTGGGIYCYYRSGASNTASITIQILAIGRWK